jgi:polysaccharide biosynthesis protein PslH
LFLFINDGIYYFLYKEIELNKTMRILFLSQALPFPIYRDGLTVRVYHLLKYLSQHADVHFIAFSDKGMNREEEKELSSFCSHEVIPYKYDGSALGALKKSISPRRYYSSDFKVAIAKAIDNFKPEAILVEQTFMSQYVKEFSEYPRVMSAVDAISFSAFLQAKIEKSLLKKAFLNMLGYQRRFIEWYYFSLFNTVTAVSEDDANKLASVIKRNVQVVPNGVDADFFSPIKCQVRDTLIFTGVLSNPGNEEACLFLFNEVFPVVRERFPHIKFVVAGRSPTSKIMAAKPEYVNLMPDLEDLRDAFHNALLFLAPIEIGAGIKNNVLQAMAMGVPVITNNLVADAINILDNSTGFVENDRAKFYQRVVDLIAEDKLLQKIGSKGRQHVLEYYSWESVALRYISMLEEEING